MLTDEALSRELAPARFTFPARPRIRGVRCVSIIDSVDEPSLNVYVEMDDDTRGEERTWARIRPLQEAMRDRLLELGEERFAYFRFLTTQELALELG